MDNRKLILRDAIREKNVNKALQGIAELKENDHPKIASVVIYYPYNEYQPVMKELDKLGKLISMLNEDTDLYIEIFGFADKQGDSYYNIGLALERSKFIRNYLIEKYVDSSRIYLRSVRQIDINTKALTKNDPENRKVEIIVFK
jgi:outer membrane protein OmpA-like peptidoglycan-associated protein